MRALFPEAPEAADNTVKIAERCRVEFEFGKTKLPRFATPDGSDNQAFFVRLCQEGPAPPVRGAHRTPPSSSGWTTRLPPSPKWVMSTTTSSSGTSSATPKAWASPWGRGGAPVWGALAAYCVGITNVDPHPLRAHLRALLKSRAGEHAQTSTSTSPTKRRDEIIDYVVGKYGADHVAQIVTFGTMAARAALRGRGPGHGHALWRRRPRWPSWCPEGRGSRLPYPGQGPGTVQGVPGEVRDRRPGPAAHRHGPEGGGHAPQRLHPRGGGGHHRPAGDGLRPPGQKPTRAWSPSTP